MRKFSRKKPCKKAKIKAIGGGWGQNCMFNLYEYTNIHETATFYRIKKSLFVLKIFRFKFRKYKGLTIESELQMYFSVRLYKLYQLLEKWS